MATELTPGLYVGQVRRNGSRFTALILRPENPELNSGWLARRMWMVMTEQGREKGSSSGRRSACLNPHI